MTKTLSISASVEEARYQVAVTSAEPTAIADARQTTVVSLQNVSPVGQMEYRVGENGSWALLTEGKSVAHAIDLSATTVYLRKAGRLDISVTCEVVIDLDGALALVVGSEGAASDVVPLVEETPVPFLGTSDSSATSNTARLRAYAERLGAYGTLVLPSQRVPINGTITIGCSVRIPKACTVVCVPGTAGGTTFMPFRNRCWNATSVNLLGSGNGIIASGTVGGLTLGKTALHTMRVAVQFATAHVGLVAGGWLLLKGDSQDVWNGIWPIESIVDTTTVTILTGFPNPQSVYTIPGSGSGTMTGAAADYGVVIFGGGTIDCAFNKNGFTHSNSTEDHALGFNRCANSGHRDINFRDVRKYCSVFANHQNCFAANFRGDTNSDGCHMYGPAWNPLIEDVSGSFGDDAAIFQTCDGATFTQYEPPEAGGSFYNGTMRRVLPHWTGNAGAAVFYPSGGRSGDLGYRFKGQQVVENCGVLSPRIADTWYSSGAFTLGAGYVPVACTIESIHLRGVRYGPITLSNAGGSTGVITVKHLQIDCVSGPEDGMGMRVQVDKVTLENVVVNGLRLVNTNANNVFDLLSANATIQTILFNAPYLSGGTPKLLGSAGGNLGTMVVNAGTLGAGAQFVNTSSTFAATPEVVINGGQSLASASAACGMGGTQAINYHIRDWKLGTGTQLVNFFGTGLIRMYCSGIIPSASAIAANLQSNVSWFNPDGSAPINLTLIARTVNSMAAHTSDSNNLYICDATATTNSWKKMTAPATTI